MVAIHGASPSGRLMAVEGRDEVETGLALGESRYVADTRCALPWFAPARVLPPFRPMEDTGVDCSDNFDLGGDEGGDAVYCRADGCTYELTGLERVVGLSTSPFEASSNTA